MFTGVTAKSWECFRGKVMFKVLPKFSLKQGHGSPAAGRESHICLGRPHPQLMRTLKATAGGGAPVRLGGGQAFIAKTSTLTEITPTSSFPDFARCLQLQMFQKSSLLASWSFRSLYQSLLCASDSPHLAARRNHLRSFEKPRWMARCHPRPRPPNVWGREADIGLYLVRLGLV